MALPGEAAGRLQREREHHRQIAPRAEWIWNWDGPAGSRRAERRAQLFVEKGGLRGGVRALELGCGTGVFLARVAPSSARLEGIDLSMDLLCRARARVETHHNVTLSCGNVEQMPYPDACFDVVYGSSVLHHLELRAALREVRRVLRPGGRIVFAEPNLLNPQIALIFGCRPLRPIFGVSPDEMAFSRFEIGKVLRELGYVDLRVEPFDFLHPSTPAALLGVVARLGRRLETLPLIREIAGSLLITGRCP
jgi:SAM-dependent methyltransferase